MIVFNKYGQSPCRYLWQSLWTVLHSRKKLIAKKAGLPSFLGQCLLNFLKMNDHGSINCVFVHIL